VFQLRHVSKLLFLRKTSERSQVDTSNARVLLRGESLRVEVRFPAAALQSAM